MRLSLCLIPLALTLTYTPASADDALIEAARDRIGLTTTYDPAYVSLAFPGGDVANDRGVCSDVIIRALRTAHAVDLQAVINADMRADFDAYPANWGLTRPDKNIDHRRVPNIETWLKRQGATLPVTKKAADYRPGDIVTWRLGGRLPHIGIVTDRTSRTGTPLIVHNIGSGTREEDILFSAPLHRHFRYLPAQTPAQAPTE